MIQTLSEYRQRLIAKVNKHMNKATFKAGTLIASFHLRDGMDRDGKLATFMLAEDVTLLMPSPEEFQRLPKFARELSERGFIVAVCGFECWIVNPNSNPAVFG
jgi:hypothetical protein